MLIEIVADRVESVCGFKPDPDMTLQFLTDLTRQSPATTRSPSQARPDSLKPLQPSISPRLEQQPFIPVPAPLPSHPNNRDVQQHGAQIGYEFAGQFTLRVMQLTRCAK